MTFKTKANNAVSLLLLDIVLSNAVDITDTITNAITDAVSMSVVNCCLSIDHTFLCGAVSITTENESKSPSRGVTCCFYTQRAS